ncbi:hypothetical protein LZ32DRAFT_395980 [Colletotrichum eremochloae]|nr:hypothetical protein LZ32DRAFT_395980 [Colletotrichum eremochloae]
MRSLPPCCAVVMTSLIHRYQWHGTRQILDIRVNTAHFRLLAELAVSTERSTRYVNKSDIDKVYSSSVSLNVSGASGRDTGSPRHQIFLATASKRPQTLFYLPRSRHFPALSCAPLTDPAPLGPTTAIPMATVKNHSTAKFYHLPTRNLRHVQPCYLRFHIPCLLVLLPPTEYLTVPTFAAISFQSKPILPSQTRTPRTTSGISPPIQSTTSRGRSSLPTLLSLTRHHPCDMPALRSPCKSHAQLLAPSH